MISVLAIIEVAEGRMDEFLAEFHKIVPLVREEDGCIEYGPWIDAETDLSRQTPFGPQKVVVIEKWGSIEKLKAHLAAPHMLAYKMATEGMTLDVTLRILSPV